MIFLLSSLLPVFPGHKGMPWAFLLYSSMLLKHKESEVLQRRLAYLNYRDIMFIT